MGYQGVTRCLLKPVNLLITIVSLLMLGYGIYLFATCDVQLYNQPRSWTIDPNDAMIHFVRPFIITDLGSIYLGSSDSGHKHYSKGGNNKAISHKTISPCEATIIRLRNEVLNARQKAQMELDDELQRQRADHTIKEIEEANLRDVPTNC